MTTSCATPAFDAGIGPHFGIAIALQPAIARAQFELQHRPAVAAIDEDSGRSGTARRPPPKRSPRSTKEFPAAFPWGGSAKPRKSRRRSCSSPQTMRRTFKARKFSSTAARPVRRQARRSIADRSRSRNHESDRHDLAENRVVVVLIEFKVSQGRGCNDISRSCDCDRLCTGETVMPKDARISVSIPASAAASQKSDRSRFVASSLFFGICLLGFLVAMFKGEPGLWY
jgi:hypothetical protein